MLSVLNSEGVLLTLWQRYSTLPGNRHMSEVAVKKYIVQFVMEERETLEALISKGKRPVRC